MASSKYSKSMADLIVDFFAIKIRTKFLIRRSYDDWALRQIYADRKRKAYVRSQRLDVDSHAKYGSDLAVSRFIVGVMGGRVRDHLGKWSSNFRDLPSDYDESYKLTGIEASNTRLITEGIDNFVGLEYLETLDLSRNPKLDDFACDQLARQFLSSQKLLAIDLSYNPLISVYGLETLMRIPSLKNIIAIDTAASSIPDIDLFVSAAEDEADCQVLVHKQDESSTVPDGAHMDVQIRSDDRETRTDANEQDDNSVSPSEAKITAPSSSRESEGRVSCDELDDDELEEGELKDDDDDDDEDDNENVSVDKNVDEVDGQAKVSTPNSDDSDAGTKKPNKGSDSSKSSAVGSNISSSGNSNDNDALKSVTKARSTRSSSSSIDRLHRPSNFSNRRGSRNRNSSRSRSRSRRGHSPNNTNHQARLVTMRAKLLEAKSREIEMKFQKNKMHLKSPIPTKSLLTTLVPLKTTISKPPITYAENPNPIEEIVRTEKRPKSVKMIDGKSKSKTSKKSSKKRKKKTSPKKKKKRAKTSETSRKGETSDRANSVITEPSNDNVDRQGPRTPPDNRVVTLDDEQVEWPSYLIKMTVSQPSISYSVNPDSVAETNPTNRSDNSDLNTDYSWYYNHFVNTFDMDKLQAQNLASSLLLSARSYDKDSVNRWLEQQGWTRQRETEDDIQVSFKEVENGANHIDYHPISNRATKPPVTTFRLHKEIVLPNGMVLPRGTIQKIVHPYPKSERVTPDPAIPYIDLY